MNTPQIFSFEQHEVRTFLENDIPYFVANDVAKTLGYKNPSKATNDHCKKSIETWGNDSLGRRQKFKVIPESDVYRLIIKSNLPSAERFGISKSYLSLILNGKKTSAEANKIIDSIITMYEL